MAIRKLKYLGRKNAYLLSLSFSYAIYIVLTIGYFLHVDVKLEAMPILVSFFWLYAAPLFGPFIGILSGSGTALLLLLLFVIMRWQKRFVVASMFVWQILWLVWGFYCQTMIVS